MQSVKNKRCKCGKDMDKAKRCKRIKYWISYRLPGGKQKREPVKGEGLNPYSIEDARKVHSKRVVQKAENKILDIKADGQQGLPQRHDRRGDVQGLQGDSETE